MIKENNKLNGKDLINIGVFAAIYMVVMVALSMLGFIPIFMILLDVLVPLICAIPFMLFLTRAKKFGMIWIFTILVGILQLLTGMGPYAIITSAVFGLLADLAAKSGGYQSSTKSVLATTIFSGWVWGDFIPMFVNKNYFNSLSNYADGYAESLKKLCPPWMLIVLFFAAFVAGFVGALIGRSVLKKHFEKAGIA